jgi:beta-lactamase class C
MRHGCITAGLILSLTGVPTGAAGGHLVAAVERLVERHVRDLLPSHGTGGAAVAVRIDGRTLFFNYGYADRAANRPVTPDALFNLGSVAKVFDATLLTLAVQRGELALEDPVARYVTELQRGDDIRRVTLGQLASFTSGLVLPQDEPPWTAENLTPQRFLALLNAWQARPGQEPGRQVRHTHSNYILLRLALERRFGMTIAELMEQRLLRPLELNSTVLPVPAADAHRHPRGRIPPAFHGRLVQGYAEDGTPSGEPGNLQGFYHWVGTGQMYSSARDLAVKLAGHLGELPGHQPLQRAMRHTQRGVLAFGEGSIGALAWEAHRQDGWTIVERYGGLDNATATLAMIPERRLGVVILCNHSQDVATAGQRLLLGLASL